MVIKVRMVSLISISMFLFILQYESNAQWSQTNGPYGGTINCLASNGQALFAGTNSGLYRSLDNGQTWAACSLGYNYDPRYPFPNMEIYSLKTSGTTVFALTNWGFTYTNDNGNNWNSMYSLFMYIKPNAIFAIKDNLIAYEYNEFSGGIVTAVLTDSFKSHTGFHYHDFNSTDTVIQAISFLGTNIFIATNNGIFVSPDTGKIWNPINSGLTRKNINALVTNGNIVFAGTDSGGVFRSTNMGASWEPINNGLKTPFIKTLAFHNNTLYAGTLGNGVFVSTDYGDNWSPMNKGINYQSINAISFHNGIPLIGTIGNGVFNYTGKWNTINTGLTATTISSVVSIGNNLFAAEKGGGIFISNDGGINWNPSNSGLTNLEVRALVAKDNKLFAGTYGDGIFVSEDNAKNWNPANNGIYQKYINALVASENNIFAGTALPPTAPKDLTYATGWSDSGIVFHTIDEGKNWKNIRSKLFNVRALAAIDDYIFVSGLVSTQRSQGEFTEWIILDTAAHEYLEYENWRWSHYVRSFGVIGNKLFAGSVGYGIYLSTDYGVTWNQVNNLDNKFISGLWDVPAFTAADTNIFVSITAPFEKISSKGVYRYSDINNLWIKSDNGLNTDYAGPFEPAVISLYHNNNYLYAGTNGFGVWKLDLSSLTELNEVLVSKPDGYSLRQNYPNPFNPTTLIKYSVPENTEVIIKIYDALGNEVSTLVNEEKPAGDYSIEFNAEGLPSGVYFYQLRTEKFVRTNKMVLLR